MKANLDEGVSTCGRNTEGRLITEAESWLKLGFRMKAMFVSTFGLVKTWDGRE